MIKSIVCKVPESTFIKVLKFLKHDVSWDEFGNNLDLDTVLKRLYQEMETNRKNEPNLPSFELYTFGSLVEYTTISERVLAYNRSNQLFLVEFGDGSNELAYYIFNLINEFEGVE